MNKYITCLAYILAPLFTNISDDVDDRLDLLQCVVVEETQPGDALLEIHLVVDELDRVVVAVCAGHPGLVEAAGEVCGVLEAEPLHAGPGEVHGKCWSSSYSISAAIQCQLERRCEGGTDWETLPCHCQAAAGVC